MLTRNPRRYVYKGHERLAYRVSPEGEPPRNEVHLYEDSRVIGSSCAMWHLQSNRMSKRIPAVQGLGVHMEHEQYQQWEAGTEREVEERPTTLTKWLDYIRAPPANDRQCRAVRYMDV